MNGMRPGADMLVVAVELVGGTEHRAVATMARTRLRGALFTRGVVRGDGQLAGDAAAERGGADGAEAT